MATTPLFIRNDGFLEAEIDGDVVLMSMEQGSCYGLDSAGSLIWRALKEPVSLEALQQLCRETYEGDPDQITGDVSALHHQLLEQELIRVCP